MKLGVLTSSVSRQAGGLYYSVRSLADGIKQVGCDVSVFSVADIFTADDALLWQNHDIHLFNRKGPEAFCFASGYQRAMDDANLDLIHTHGLWLYQSIAAHKWSRKWSRPEIVSPRGMLDSWAVKNSYKKKVLAGYLYENAHLKNASCLHALCISEYESIRAYGLNNPVAIIPNGVDLQKKNVQLANTIWSKILSSNCRVLLFLGRIHPKKGLINLLKAWSLAHNDKDKLQPWHLVIAGWDQNDHQSTLERLILDLNLADNVHIVGPQFNQNKDACLNRADAFILPSYSEGLPMAVLEAWSCGLPVVMTRECNLEDGFDEKAAIQVTTDVSSLVDGLNILFDMETSELKDMGECGRMLISKRYNWSLISAEMIDTYKWILGYASKPKCVVTD